MDYTQADQVTTSVLPLLWMIEDCLATIDPMVDADQVRILCEIPGDLAKLVQGERKLRRILINLLGNAAKFTEKVSIPASNHLGSGHGKARDLVWQSVGVSPPSWLARSQSGADLVKVRFLLCSSQSFIRGLSQSGWTPFAPIDKSLAP